MIVSPALAVDSCGHVPASPCMGGGYPMLEGFGVVVTGDITGVVRVGLVEYKRQRGRRAPSEQELVWWEAGGAACVCTHGKQHLRQIVLPGFVLGADQGTQGCSKSPMLAFHRVALWMIRWRCRPPDA